MRRSSRVPKPVDYLTFNTTADFEDSIEDDDVGFRIIGSCYAVSEDFEPGTYAEAVNGPDASKWVGAMGEEYDALVSRQYLGSCGTATKC